MYEKLDESKLLIKKLRESGFEITNRHWVYDCGWKFIIIKKRFMKLENLKKEVSKIVNESCVNLKESDIYIED